MPQIPRSFQERFGDFLQSRGMRNTRQRERILQLVVAQTGPFDAEQLLATLPSAGDREQVSRPTVYRTLVELVDAGLVRKFELNGRSLYAIDTGSEPAEHLYCVECQSFVDVEIPELTEMRNRLAADHQFQVQSHRLVVDGVCHECRQKKRRARKRVDLI
jgi:Fur family ferric uptake transcriptional regulator